MRLRYLSAVAILVVVAALGVLALRGESGIQAANIFNAHVHDDYFHPTQGFVVGPSHTTAQALCMAATPDAACTVTIQEGDSLMWVAPAPLAVNAHSVTECTDNTFSLCGAGSSAPNPIEDSGVRFQPGWPYLVAFNDPGTFYYRCDIHPGTMRGVVSVIAGVGGTVELLGTDGGSSSVSEAGDSTASLTYVTLAVVAALLGIVAGGFALRQRHASRVTGED